MDTMIYQQTFTIIADGVADDLVTNIVPCSLSSELYYNNYQPTPAEGDEAQRILDKIEERSSWIPEYTPASDDSSEDTSEELSDDSSEDSADEISE
jgi:poly-gamma-glutamate synthesis protein (capsule biosynthesis protein)